MKTKVSFITRVNAMSGAAVDFLVAIADFLVAIALVVACGITLVVACGIIVFYFGS